MKIIDSHVHIGLNSFCNNQDTEFSFDLSNTYQNVIELMDSNDIERVVLLPIPHKDFDSYKCNDYVYEAYSKYPNRFIPFCRIDHKLEENLRKGFKGAKLHLLYEDIDVKKIKYELRLLEDAGLPLIVHALFKNKVKQIESILKIAPNLKIVLAHMGRGHLYTDEGVIDNALALKKYENVYFETSTIGKIDAIIETCNIVGDDKVIFGSDHPFGENWFRGKCNYEYSMELALYKNNGVDEILLQKILYDNIYKLLNLNNEEKILIRRVRKVDYDQIINIFNIIDEKDKKYLALEPKTALIKQIIKKESHCYVACIHEKIIGFMRESGRPEGFSLLEELVIDPNYRNSGVATAIIKYYHNIFSKNMAKTNAGNKGMILLLQKFGYKANNPNAPRIINWERVKE